RRYLIAAYALVGLVAVWAIWRGGRWVVPLTRVLNVGLGALVILNTFNIGSFVATASASDRSVEPAEVSASGHPRPAVFYIILDRYPNGWPLDNLYDHDNTAFLDALRERGFAVAEQAWANYFKTAFSLVSSL